MTKIMGLLIAAVGVQFVALGIKDLLPQILQKLTQSDKLSSLGELVSGVAHELNNPLTAAMGYSELLLNHATDEKIKKKAIALMADYKREIISSMRWYDQNKNSSRIIKGSGYLIINAQDQIRPTLAGTMASMVSRSNGIKEKFILSMAQIADGTTKVSLRMSEHGNGVDLKQIISEIVNGLPNCEAGGHSNAAGALIATEMEEEFIKRAEAILEKRAMEEIV